MLTFTYNLSTDYYPVKGLDAQLKAEVAPDLDNSSYWIGSVVIYGLISVSYTHLTLPTKRIV